MFDWFWKGVFGIPPSAKLTKEDKRTIRELVIETYLGDAKTPNMSIPGPLATMAGTAFAVFGGAEALIKGLNVINPRIKKIKELSDWRDPQSTPTRRDPLVLDLNRDGKVELKNAAYFDLNANGFHEFTRWIDKTDAFLVLDKNFNSKADVCITYFLLSTAELIAGNVAIRCGAPGVLRPCGTGCESHQPCD